MLGDYLIALVENTTSSTYDEFEQTMTSKLEDFLSSSTEIMMDIF